MWIEQNGPLLRSGRSSLSRGSPSGAPVVVVAVVARQYITVAGRYIHLEHATHISIYGSRVLGRIGPG